MSATTTSQSGARLQGTKRRVTPTKNGTADPRPLTDYSVTLSTVGGHSRLTVNLSQPCVIRNPLWPLVDCNDGSLVTPTTCTVVNNTSFFMDFAVLLGTSVALVQVPYQDMNVQNFRGGYVRPGGQWFRKPA